MELKQKVIKEIARKKAKILYLAYKRDPYLWLGNVVKTFDEHDKKNPVKSFPLRPYIKPIVDEFLKPDQVLLLTKSRQMMASWLFTALLLHQGQFFGYQKEAFFSKKQDDAHLLVERSKFIYTHQPLWLRNMCPITRRMTDMPKGELYFENGSVLVGLAQGADQVRSQVPSTAFLDEMAFQTEAKQTYIACLPCAQKIVGVSSANGGFFARLTENEN